jgi:hypothetical protein
VDREEDEDGKDMVENSSVLQTSPWNNREQFDLLSNRWTLVDVGGWHTAYRPVRPRLVPMAKPFVMHVLL